MLKELRFVILVAVSCNGFKVERLTNGAGDVFDKIINLPNRPSITIGDYCHRNLDGTGSASQNGSACQCGWSQTFVVDTIDQNDLQAKCIQGYGDNKDDLGEC